MANTTTNVGSTKQLFLDDSIVESTDNAARRLHRPRRYEGNPVLKVDRPWESAGGGVYLFGGTVMYDEEDGIFKPTFPRSAAWVRRNPVRVLPILAAYMVGMGSVCARLAEIAGFGSGYRNLAGGTQWVKAPTPL